MSANTQPLMRLSLQRLSAFMLMMVPVLAAYLWVKPVQPPVFLTPTAQVSNDAVWQESRFDQPEVRSVHASFVVNLPDNTQGVFWFGGSREGHRDVQIYRALMQNGQMISAPQAVLSASMLADLSSRYIKKLGNPVLSFVNDTLYLWVVNVSVGGWATARVDLLSSEDLGANFGYLKSLRMSPFFNQSTLVKTRPVPMSQGLLLPAYFEMNRMDPVMIYFDADMAIRSSHTLLMDAIQPVVVVDSDQTANVFARPNDQGFIQNGQFQLDSAAWQGANLADMSNASSDLSIVRLSATNLLMAHNPAPDRSLLLLSLSQDNGATWQRVKVIEQTSGERFSYPSMLIDEGGFVHLSYTNKRKFISYIRFSIASLNLAAVLP
jgi:predicted neuraminidase